MMLTTTSGVNPAMAIPRPDLVMTIGEQVAHAYELQHASDYPRAMHGDALPEVVVCLGSGRCLFPTRGAEKRFCPFCVTMPQDVAAYRRQKDFVRKVIAGN
jgi:hypothetical protein